MSAAEDPNRSLPDARLGLRESYEGYGIGGAHVSSSPFRKTKKFAHEGGIASPLIVHWPAGIGKSRHGRLGGATFPKTWNGSDTTPLAGVRLTPALRGEPLQRPEPLFWEHEGHRAIRDGKWKLVATFNDPWELYDLEADRTELKDLSQSQPERTRVLTAKYEAWASRAGVKPWPQPQTPPAKKSSTQKAN